jgi:hypothetical protein
MSASTLYVYRPDGGTDRLRSGSLPAGKHPQSLFLVVQDGKRPHIVQLHVVTKLDARAARRQDVKGTLTAIVGDPFLTSGHRKLMCWPVRNWDDDFYDAVGLLKPRAIDNVADIDYSAPIAVDTTDGTDPTWYIIDRAAIQDDSAPNGYRISHDVILRQRLTVEAVHADYDITKSRTLKHIEGSDGFLVTNHRAQGIRQTFFKLTDMFKTAGYATWHAPLRITLDATNPKHITRIREYLRVCARHAIEDPGHVHGLGPVIEPGTKRTVFVDNRGSFDIHTGQSYGNYRTSLDKPGLTQFGISDPTDEHTIADGYRHALSFIDSTPFNRGVTATLLGIVATAPLSTLERDFRTLVYVDATTGTGKTQLSKILLAMQSPTARGRNGSHSDIDVTASMRTGTGGTTTNGALMSVDYAGGFLAVLDDFLQEGSSQRDKERREAGLSILLGCIEGNEPDKQNWGKAGPEFARSFSPRASLLLNAEIPATTQLSNLRRLIELKLPAVKFKDTDGIDSTIVGQLLTTKVGDALHIAWSDCARWTLAHQAEMAVQLATAVAVTSGWDDVDPSLRRVYSIALAGIQTWGQRAEQYGVTYDLDLLSKHIHQLALEQTIRMAGETESELSRVLRITRDLLQEGRICIPGPATYSDDGNIAELYTDPFSIANRDITEPDIVIERPSWMPERNRLGMIRKAEGWEPASQHNIIGYLLTPNPEKKACFPYRIAIDSQNMRLLAQKVSDRSEREGGKRFSDKQLRSLFLGATNLAETGKHGGLRHDKYRVVMLNAETVLTTDIEDD